MAFCYDSPIFIDRYFPKSQQRLLFACTSIVLSTSAVTVIYLLLLRHHLYTGKCINLKCTVWRILVIILHSYHHNQNTGWFISPASLEYLCYTTPPNPTIRQSLICCHNIFASLAYHLYITIQYIFVCLCVIVFSHLTYLFCESSIFLHMSIFFLFPSLNHIRSMNLSQFVYSFTRWGPFEFLLFFHLSFLQFGLSWSYYWEDLHKLFLWD